MSDNEQASDGVTRRVASCMGGLDGVLVTFGDGCDDDTWNALFGRLAGRADGEPWSVRLFWADGSETDAKVVEWASYISDVDSFTVAFRPVVGDDWDHLAPVEYRSLAELVGVHVY